MGFNIGFSKRDTDRFYLPGQEIQVSHGTVSAENYMVESENVLLCRQRIWLVASFFFMFYLLLCARVSYVCLSNGVNINVALSDDKNMDKDIMVAKNPVRRADILDRNGEIIATSLPTANLFANTKYIQNPEEVAEKLTEIFTDIPYETFLKKLNKKSSFVYLYRNMSPAQQSQVNGLGIPGLEFEDAEKRVYPHHNLVSHVIGKTDLDNTGISGLEKFLDGRLTGSDKPISLTIDLGVQNTIRDELIAGVKQFSADGAVGILMDVNNGQVLAMVSVPDFDPNNSAGSDGREMFNFATKGIYEAGSVFKVFNTALGLESGKIKTTDKFDTTKSIFVSKLKVSDPHPPHGWFTPEDILVHSSNIGSVQEVLRVGKKYQREFLQNLNMDKELSSFEITEKAKPQFLSEKRWGDQTMATISFGYGIASTPLHIISAFSAVVNGGIYHNPTIIKDNTNQESHRVMSEENSIAMRSLLRAVVERGTGKRANVEGYQVMGKTGTADKLSPHGGYDRGKSMSTFVSSFPSSNPKYALLVLMDNPKASKETFGYTTAGWNSVPISKNIISAVAPQLNLVVDFDIEKQKSIVNAAYKK